MSLVRLAHVALKNIISVVDRQETNSERRYEKNSTNRRVTETESKVFYLNDQVK
jgi:hypothetical protein